MWNECVLKNNNVTKKEKRWKIMYAIPMMQNKLCDINIEHIKWCKTMYAICILNIRMIQDIAFDIANAAKKMFVLKM